MEPLARAAPQVSLLADPRVDAADGHPDADPHRVEPPRPVHRLRVLIASAALVALAFSQQPGLIVGDTKADLVLDPGGFLRRALSAWDPLQGFGQLPNQSYGYLWPIGPFFWAGDGIGLPAWVVQRSWWALLLVVGFTGALRLAGELRIGAPSTRLVAALTYALSPRVLSELGSLSVEVWPAAVLPWVLVPLVRGARGELSPRRAAAWSGVAVACLGGVNAAATLAVLPLPALYLATRPRAVRRRLVAWWAPTTLLATAWWVLPLLVLGRYAYPFLTLIEDAGVTTQVATVTNTLRGTSHWLGFLVVHGAPRWPAGFDLAVSPVPVAASAAVAALGLAGLLLPGLRERRWLLGGVLLGTALVALGHSGALTGPLAPTVRELLDGPLAPLRNVHKADPLIRLPFALGLAHLLTVGTRVRWRRLPVPGLAVAAVAALLAGTAAPAWSGRLAPAGAYQQTPAYWRDVAAWLSGRAASDGGGRALLVPSSNFADYRWGSPQDEPLQALARSPWAVRDAVPLGAPGATRLLDALDARLATGQPSAAYASVLARAGVRYVVVRNDIDVNGSGSERPGVVWAALAGSPGIHTVATFGPRMPSAYAPQDAVVGSAEGPPAVEVFEVGSAPQRVAVYPRAGAVALSGGPEGALPLADAGLLDGRAVLAAADLPASPAGAVDAVVGTDTMRRRSLNPGADPGRRYSPTLSATQEPDRRDVTPYPGPTHESVALLEGSAEATASSSAADPFAAAYRGPDRRPAAAVDGDPATAWISDAGTVGQWIQVRLGSPARPASVALSLLDDPAVGPRVTRVEVATD
ncbi:MAG TPA: alpha-(1-_3)-arabinofuranosyltransferase family protein, partial [Mycobacteriales bacterium]|nr:alpha-(1->3)-arabinofuranosyltransferase family protein [Mycobacteriales bacterium]